MAYTIWDEARLHHQANKLDSIASKYDAMANDLRSCTAPLHSQWVSPARDAWVAERDSVLKSMVSTASELRGIASGIRSYTASMHYLLEEAIEIITGDVD